ncbi:MAG: HAD family phosphatase [Treponema sp.]|nr:HAD family phosphatase [Treponema sp.]
MLFIFDMGGVCCNTWKGTGKISEILGLKKEEFESIYGKDTKDSLFHKCTIGEIDTAGFWKEFNKRCGIKVFTDWFHYLFHPVLIQETVELIEELKKKGHRVVCGTNTISGHYANHVENGDYSIFDQTYASCFMGVAKPDPDFYRLILKAEEASAENTVFIDDRIENVEAAAGIGITAIQYKNSADLRQKIFNLL